MPAKYPPLTPGEVREILRASGFVLVRTRGSHELWGHDGIEGKPRAVTVDAALRDFGVDLVKSMISQSGLSRESFYGATRATARKIGQR